MDALSVSGAALLGSVLSGAKLESVVIPISLRFKPGESGKAVSYISHVPVMAYSINNGQFLAQGRANWILDGDWFYVTCTWSGTSLTFEAISKNSNSSTVIDSINIILIN